jgi:signal transduction histidine kinase/CheY-like chemotaxis protein/HPt (histidine-containing phosphotransfer) domain-containing protein
MLLATAVAWWMAEQSARDRAWLRFGIEAEDVETLIVSRMQRYQDALAAGAGLFAARGSVSREEWREFVGMLKIQRRLPGIQGLGFALRVPPEQLAEHIEKVRAEGFPDYTVRPEGERPDYYSIVYLEPFEGRNLRAFGYDMFSESRRRTAMERARDTAEPALSGAVTLVQEMEADVQKGFLLYHPVYRNGSDRESLERRRSQLLGFVYCPFRVADLMRGILGAGTRDVQFRIFDGATSSLESLLYDSSGPTARDQPAKGWNPEFTKISELRIGGHTWTLHYRAGPGFFDRNAQHQPTLIVLGGLSLVALLFMTFVAMLGEKDRALRLAEVMREGAQTHLERAEDALRELEIQRRAAESASRAKGEFLAKMSHEIRTPMNGVIGLTELLLDTPLNVRQKTYAESIRGSADNLLLIINDILDLSKIEAGRLEIELADLDLHDAVEAVVDLLASSGRKKGVQLTLQMDPSVPVSVRGDARRLKQVLTNLVGNALKFTSQGEVAVRVTRVGITDGAETLRFEVRDTGCGIAPDVQGRLFAPFSQGDADTSRKYGGTGLGLAISRQLVQLMRGEIGLISEPGKGATFWFTLPFQQRRAPTGETEYLLNRAPLAGRRVLLVGVRPQDREILSRSFAAWGLLMESAASGTEALVRLRVAQNQNDLFDWILVERRLEDQDALEFARQARSIGPGAFTARLLLIGEPDESLDASGGDAAGFLGLILQPIRQSQVRRLMLELETPGASARRPENQTASQVSLGSRPPGRDMRILLVEDHPVNQKVAIGKLLQMGYEAYPCANGVEALKAIEKVPYDVVLMDCEMPEMDGYTATREIRRRTREKPPVGGVSHSVYIIAMTADAMAGTRERCFQAGMNDYVSKPVTSADLKVALDRAVAQLQSSVGPLSNEVTSVVLEEGMLEELRPLRSEDGASQFLALVDMFLEDTPRLLCELARAMETGDTAEVVAIAHKLKSASGYFGARQMSMTCHQLKELGRSGKVDFGTGLMRRLEREFALVRAKLGEERERFSGNETEHRDAA